MTRVALGAAIAVFACLAAQASSPFLPMRTRLGPVPCPQGFHAVESPLGFRCLAGGGEKPRPVRDAEKVLSARRPAPPLDHRDPIEFFLFSDRGIGLRLPRGWHVTDAWKDEVPTVYVERGAERAGKPVTLLISKLAPGQTGYLGLDEAVAQEKEFRGAREVAARKVSGLPARQTLVAGESRTVYASASGGAYYVLSYSAPKELFKAFEPAFDKLVSSAQLSSQE